MLHVKNIRVIEFPSPYGVSFILIQMYSCFYIQVLLVYCFRLLTEYHSFLLNGKNGILD